ncbi:MAG: Rpn family recombination-promoting nuclease/putative transposase [Spirochaetales bacterium]|nr:Rpn family recombination-promoting nuclease/putative transposase [Spirochaetales bacterium]
MAAYINPVSDFFVRYLLGSESNKEILIDFINTVLLDLYPDFEIICDITILNPFNQTVLNLEKESILDVKAQDRLKRIYNIEIQVARQSEFKERSLYYWAKLFSGQLAKGDEYKTLNPVISINLLDFILFPEMKKPHNCFTAIDDRTKSVVLSNMMQIHYFELPKMDEEPDNLAESRLARWAFYFKNEGRIDENELKRLIVEGDPVMEKAHDAYKDFSMSDELIEAYEAHQKYLRDKAAEIDFARKEGLELGIEKTNLKNAKAMEQEGISYEIIQKVTGISEQQLKEGNKEL